MCCSIGSLEVFSIARLTKEASHKRLVLGKVPLLSAMLKSVAPQGNGACVVLKDPTGMSYRDVCDLYYIPVLLNNISLFMCNFGVCVFARTVSAF